MSRIPNAKIQDDRQTLRNSIQDLYILCGNDKIGKQPALCGANML